ncbi:Hypothetical protein (Fragment) [Durusdinium trenchii]|uniref:Uncharacterized protein n=1 Tax=Durusdinium trenchii TaxID=1381693 RepID=A0ABP0S462_9DINO
MAFFSFDSFKKGAGKKRAASDSESESSEPKPKAASAAPPVAKAQDVKETPSELLAVAKELQTTAELARRFAVATLRQWKQQGDGALGEAPDMSSLEPLLDLLLAKALDEKEEEHMKQCCLQSLEGKHLLAQKSYIDLIHGSKTWVTGGLLYISSDEPKGNERMWGQKWRKIEDKGSLLDNAATQKALQSFKRLLSFHEKASGVPV